MPLKSVSALFSLIAGSIGVVASMVAAYPVRLVESRLDRTNERVFQMIDRGLASVEDRVRVVQKRVRESKTNAGEIAQSLRDWVRTRANERLMSAVDIERRTEKWAGNIQMAEQWLESSIESIRGMQQLLELGASVGAPIDAMSLEGVLDRLATIQGRLQETEQSIKDIRKFTVNRADESQEHRLSRVFKLIGSTELAADAIDTRLDESVTRLSQMHAGAKQLQIRTSNFISLITGGCYLVLVWIAAGQAALCLYGWKNCFGRRLLVHESHTP